MNAHTLLHSFGAALVGGVLVLLSASACSGPSADGRTQFKGPDTATFKTVADMLGKRCGTLDCHGSTARSLRIYSYRGLRLDPADVPGVSGDTTDAEYQATYTSVLTLEPEIMGKVLFQHGDPTELTIVRKARGTEHHKGGTVLKTGGAADRCLIGWLTGKGSGTACADGLALPHTPKPFQGL
jgi:hypothetical protein